MAEPELEGREVGSFLLANPIGRGGFATVYRARQLRLGRDVAMKVLDPDVVVRSPAAARRFEREGRSVAALDHPNIVPVYEAGEEGGVVFLAMRLVEGGSLADELARRGPLDAARTVAVAEAVGAALDAAHAAGIIHRDVKPSNVLIEGERIWLSDFGIAVSLADIGRYTAGSIGTAAYMAPEQADGGELDHRADLYSLGCVAYECVTGHVPFPDAGSPVRVLHAHVHESVATVGDAALDAFFARALAKDPADRFSSGAELAAALRSALPADHGTASSAAGPASIAPTVVDPTVIRPPEPRAATSGRRSGRRRVAARIGLGVLVAVVVAGSFFGIRTAIDRSGPVVEGAPDERLVTEPAPVAFAQGGQVEAGVDLDLDTLNPHVDVDAASVVSSNVLPTLVDVTEDFGLVDNLAAGEPVLESTDALAVQWELRADAVWDDGTPITSDDVRATYDYVIDDSVGATGTELYRRISGIDVIDDHHFRVRFDEPVAPYRLLFSTNHPIIKAAALDDWVAAGNAPSRFLEEGIAFSGGPYRIAEFRPGARVSLVRNERWWGEAPHLDRVTVSRYDSATAQMQAVDDGAIDLAFVRFPEIAQVEEARAVEGATVTVGPAERSLGLLFNAGSGPTSDPAVRRGIAEAVDRQLIADTLVGFVTGSAATPLDSLVYLPNQPEYEPAFASIGGDPLEAGRLLDDAGWILGADGVRARDGQTLTLGFTYPDDDELGQSAVILSDLLRRQLADVGVSLEPRPVSRDEWGATRAVGDFDVILADWVANVDPTVAVLFYSANRCPATVPGCIARVGANWGNYRNEQVTALLDATDSTFDPEARATLFAQADRAMALDVPALPLYQTPAFVVHDESLLGVSLSPARGGPLNGLAGWGRAA